MISDDLKILCSLSSPSGSEGEVCAYAAKRLEPFCDEVRRDNAGNLIAVKKSGKSGAKRLMLEAHGDEVGFMVSKIDEKGFLHFEKVGGTDDKILPASIVCVHGKKDIYGVIGIKPPHIQSRDENKKTVSYKELRIDVAMPKSEAEKYISVGDFVTFVSEYTELKNGIVSAKSLDNRVSVAVLIEAMEKLSDAKLDIDVYAVIAASEEAGLRGAAAAAEDILPDFALVCDVTFGISYKCREESFDIGEGLTYSVGPSVSEKLNDILLRCASDNNIKLTKEVTGDSTGTDAWAIQVSGTGVYTAVISIPERYMHTAVETLSLSDAEKAALLMEKFVLTLSKEADKFGIEVIA